MSDYSGPGSGRGGSDRVRDWRHLSSLFEQLPPHAIEAEASLLGAMLIDPKVIGDVMLIVRSGDDFFKPANGAIFDAMIRLYDAHASLDLVQLHRDLADSGTLEAVGGLDYLASLANAVPTAANAPHYGRLVREKACLRQLIGAAGEILQEAYGAPDETREILERAEQKIFRIAQQSEAREVQSLSELLQETMATIEANQGKQITGLPTGYLELDNITGGLQKGEMIIVAARPSMGKTSLALNIAEQVALGREKHGVGIFSLEMGKQQLVQRLLAARANIDSHRFRRNMLSKEDFRSLMVTCDELQEAPIFIDDTPGLSLLQMRAKARRMASKHNIGVIIIDYLQLLSTGGRTESRQVEVGEISRGVKAMSRELEVPVICLSQLNRAAEQREGHRPRMSDLRDSGSIEQDADVVAMLHREEYYNQTDPEWADQHPDKVGMAELIIAKQRNGPTGTVPLSSSASTMRFHNYSSAAPPGGYYEAKSVSRQPAASRAGDDLPV